VGLETRVDTRGNDLAPGEIAAIDLARCLVRRPDVLVVERALEGLPPGSAAELIKRLRRTLIGRGLVAITPDLSPDVDQPPFDVVVRFENGAVASVQDRRARQGSELEVA
jgi:ABC-type transport system involved in cytochrome bd biosynthesis fused ATPase/permease subunit